MKTGVFLIVSFCFYYSNLDFYVDISWYSSYM